MREGAAGSAHAGTPVPGRALAVEIDFGTAAPITVYSLYLVTGNSLCDANLATLAAVGADARSRALPFHHRGRLPSRPARPRRDHLCTASGRRHHRSRVPADMPARAAPAAPVPGWPSNPHRPIAINIAADYADLYVLRFGTHVALPADVPIGPSPRPPPLVGGRQRRPL